MTTISSKTSKGFYKLGRAILTGWAIDRGFTEDRYGNLLSPGKTKRLKLNKIKARYEKKVNGRWLRIRSGFYRDICIVNTPEGEKLRGLTARF